MSLARRVLASTGRAVIITAPAASGKTAAAIELYRHYEQSAGHACLLIAPSATGARELRGRLLGYGEQAVAVAPRVSTFATLAADILAAGEQSPGGLSALARRLMLRDIIDELNAGGQLTALGAVADTPGLAESLDRSISELKRAAIEPDALVSTAGRAKSRLSDLLAVYRAYQERLVAAGRYDLEGRMWLARDLLAAGRGVPSGVAAVVADGFTDFTPTQLEMLVLLAKAGLRVIITLPWAHDGRERMWQWTRRTLETVRKAFGEDLEEILSPAPSLAGEAPSLTSLWSSVFNFDAEPCPPPPGVSVIAAAGADAEVAAVARRVKRLLMEGAEAGSIAVIVRSSDTYRPTIQRIFAECEIPLAEAPRGLTDVPIVRFALDAANLGPNFAFRDVIRVITNSYFRPAAIGKDERKKFDERTVAAARELIRRGNVLAGRGACLAAAQRLTQPDVQADEEGEEEHAQSAAHDFMAAADMLEKLFAISDGDAASVIRALDLWTAAGEHDKAELAARDLRGLSTLEDALSELGERRLSGPLLKDALSAVTCPPARTESLVDVMDVLDARACRWRHVFLMGLGQGQFPRRQSGGSLISEADRAEWRERGVVLDSRSDLDAREMLLFYMAVSRADATLTLSYPSSDSGGSYAAPGSFLLSLAAAAGGLDALDTEEILPGRFLPASAEIASARDALCAGVAGLFDGETPTASGALAWSLAQPHEAVKQAAMGIWAHTNRWRQGPCDAFDGRISDEALRGALAEQFGPRHVFSAGQLETFAQCPWRFFAQYVLHLEPLAEPQRSLEAVARGIFCHDVLCDVYRHLRGNGKSVDLSSLAQADVTATLDDAVADASARIERRNPPYPMLWLLQREQMREQLRRYLLEQAAGGGEAENLHFELAFGTDRHDADEASSHEPVEIDTPAGPMKLRGRIDRVDALCGDGSGKLLVVDYKTGQLPGKADFDSARSLQAPLYAAAITQILGRPCAGGAFHRIGSPSAKREQFFASVKRSRGSLVTDSTYKERREAAMSAVAGFVNDIRAGTFDVAPRAKCPSYCHYRQICGYSEARAQVKTPDDASGPGEDS